MSNSPTPPAPQRRRDVPGWMLTVLVPAALMTTLNVIKPAHIDDTVFIDRAIHLSREPLDPYGPTVFWFQWPEPANWLLCPIGLPYWLALGVRVVGESVPALKLWMFPPTLLLLSALRGLLRQFEAVAVAGPLLWLIALSPLLLPGINLMLEVPAAALTLAAVGLFLRALPWGEPGPRRAGAVIALSAAAGAVAGLAFHTKWTSIVAPAVFVLAALLRRRRLAPAVALATMSAVVVSWEGYVAYRYGQSHLLFQLGWKEHLPTDRWPIVPSLLPLLGAACGGLLPPALEALRRRMPGLPPWLPYAALVLPPLAYAVVPDINHFPWLLAGVGLLTGLALAAVAWRLIRPGAERGLFTVRGRETDWLLVAWLVVEAGAYFVIAPFAAIRRMLGLTVVATLLVGRALARAEPVPSIGPSAGADPSRRLLWTSAAAWGAVGLFVATIDLLDARAQQVGVERAAAWIRGQPGQSPQARICYAGHWGFQWYAERAGMTPMVPDETRLQAGDWLVANDRTPAPEFFWPKEAELVHQIEVTDPLPVSALALYAKDRPLMWSGPVRCRVGIFRMTGDARFLTRTPPAELVRQMRRRWPHVPPAAAGALLSAMRFGEPEVSAEASRLLLQMGSPALLRALDDEQPAVRLWACRAIARLPRHDDALGRRLAELEGIDPDANVRAAAREALTPVR